MIEIVPGSGLSFGWFLIIGGAIMLLVEAYSPGFFIAVPGTVLIILGIFALFLPEVFNSPWIILIGIVVAFLSAGITIWLYGRLTPDESPVTISRDSVIGREGRVIREVNEHTIEGKVDVGGVQWSARSRKGAIPANRCVRVVTSEGVHIVVEEVE